MSQDAVIVVEFECVLGGPFFDAFPRAPTRASADRWSLARGRLVNPKYPAMSIAFCGPTRERQAMRDELVRYYAELTRDGSVCNASVDEIVIVPAPPRPYPTRRRRAPERFEDLQGWVWR